jgi:cGMP-dependent protein kinase
MLGRAAAQTHGDSSIRFQDLRAICTLGTGTFGRVKLVEHTPTKRAMALKCMQKAQIVASHQQKNVVSERDVMIEADHPFVLKLYRTFQDKNCIFMLLELVQGGELWTLLYQNTTSIRRSKIGGFPADASRFYAGCVTSAFDFIHGIGVAYRDLKPENLLLDDKGYLKVVDFGFAKRIPYYKGKLRQDKTFTLCGTPEYLSPELVLSKGHDRGVDYWALGILIFELLTGGTPFADPSQQKIFEKIIHSGRHLKFPRGFDSSAQDLIKKLLNPNPQLRLGHLRGGVKDIISHKWFAALDWNALVNKRIAAPYVPKIKGLLDSSNYDQYDEHDNIQAYRDNGKGYFDTF